MRDVGGDVGGVLYPLNLTLSLICHVFVMRVKIFFAHVSRNSDKEIRRHHALKLLHSLQASDISGL